MNTSATIQLAGFTLELLPEKAIYIKELNALLVADVHLGKALHFRANGMPVPMAIEQDTLSRFQALVSEYQPGKVIILGDLFHSPETADYQAFNSLQNGFKNIEWHLVVGNHDKPTKIIQFCPQLQLHNNLQFGSIFLCHHPPKELNADLYAICGHIHPAVMLGKGISKLGLPCFYLENSILTMPAFGSFTGNYYIKPVKKSEVFVVSPNAVRCLNSESITQA